jgi:ribosomal protein S18 acetylase RimI-like enzyme
LVEMIALEAVVGSRESWIPLLLEADGSEPVVRSYLDEGELFAILEGDETAGVLLAIREGDTLEIKNLAIAAARRGRGVGRAAIGALAERATASGVTRLTVGTANSSLDALRFYQRVGFRIAGVRRGFFASYPEPIVEDGIRALDMVMLDREL